MNVDHRAPVAFGTEETARVCPALKQQERQSGGLRGKGLSSGLGFTSTDLISQALKSDYVKAAPLVLWE